MLIDTHCHIHIPDYKLDADEEVEAAKEAGVEQLIIVGEDANDSLDAINFCEKFAKCFPTAGLHPHRASQKDDLQIITELANKHDLVAIGECGLDYFYLNSSKNDQHEALTYQLKLAQSLKLPLSFHVRGSKDDPEDAFNDFFELFDKVNSNDEEITGVVHSFTSGKSVLEKVISRGLYVGLNGIATFADPKTQEALTSVPLESLLLETDSPFLAPAQKRGAVNSPKNLVLIAEHLAKQRKVSVDEIVARTTANAAALFSIEA